MADFVQALATGPQVEWLVGTVIAITGATITVNCLGGEVEDVTPVEQYAPTVGDVVHMLSLESHGMLAIGSVPPAAPRQEPPPTGVAVTLDPSIIATYDQITGVWELGVIRQEPDKIGCWFYDSELLRQSAGMAPAAVAIQVTQDSGDGSPEFVLHNASEPVGSVPILTAVPFGVETGGIGVPTWMNLPLGWGYDLIAGDAHGIGVVSSLFTGDYTSSTGRLRLTPV